MKKKWKTATLTVVGIALVANPYSLKLIELHSSADEIYYSQDNALYDKQLQETTDLINHAKTTMVDGDIKKAIDSVIQLPYPTDYKTDVKNNLLDEVFNFINGLTNNDLKARYGTYFVEQAVNRVTKSLIWPDYDLADALVSTLPDGAIKTKYSTILDATKKQMGQNMLDGMKNSTQGGKTPYIDWSHLPPEAFAPYQPTDTGDYLPGYPLPGTQDKPPAPNPNALPEENYSLDSVYQTINNQCYKVTTKTIEGKSPVVTKELVTGDDTTFCSVAVMNGDTTNSNQSYDLNNIQPAPPASGDNINGGVQDVNSYSGIDDSTSQNQDTVKGNPLTLQFTLDRTEKNPYFYETDMVVGNDGTITYQQIHDVLFQLAIRSGGKAVEDKDRFLILLENKIIVVQNQGDNIPVNTFDTLLKGFKAEVKAMPPKVGQ